MRPWQTETLERCEGEQPNLGEAKVDLQSLKRPAQPSPPPVRANKLAVVRRLAVPVIVGQVNITRKQLNVVQTASNAEGRSTPVVVE